MTLSSTAMKTALAFLVLASCVVSPEPQPWTQTPDADCDVDADCGGLVCTRTHECAAPDDVHVAHIFWTVTRRPADAASCANGPDVFVQLQTDPLPGMGEIAEFGPMACTLGQFTIDKLAGKYWIAGVRNRETAMALPFDETWTAHVDIPF